MCVFPICNVGLKCAKKGLSGCPTWRPCRRVLSDSNVATPPPWLQEAHIAKLRGNLDTGGDASLQNALDLAVGSLSSIPPYGHRWGHGQTG